MSNLSAVHERALLRSRLVAPARGLAGDAEQQRRKGNSKRAHGAHALRI